MVKLKKLIKKFKLESLNESKVFPLDKETISVTKLSNGLPWFNNEYKDKSEELIVLGGDEFKFLRNVKNFSPLFKNLKDNDHRIIIVTKDFDASLIIEDVKVNDLFLLKTTDEFFEFNSKVIKYLMLRNSKPKRIHSCLVNVFGEGVLIKGASGIGKSELVVDLIQKNHLFIGDDAIDIYLISNELIGKSSKKVRDFIELRGLGILNIKRVFGIKSIQRETKIDLIINLIEMNDKKYLQIDRLGKENLFEKILGIKKPLIEIPVLKGRNLSSLIESSVIVHKLRKYDNYYAIEDMIKANK